LATPDRAKADAVPAPALGKVVVVGVGLIGGSFALALKAAGAAATVVGVGRGASNLNLARQLGIADRTWTQDQRWTDELTDANLVLLATPVGQIPALLVAIAPALGRATVVTDAGSTKQDVIAAARRYLGAAFPRFVPGHPIAGTERSGAAAASDALFRGRSVILTPLPETSADAQMQIAMSGAAATEIPPEVAERAAQQFEKFAQRHGVGAVAQRLVFSQPLDGGVQQRAEIARVEEALVVPVHVVEHVSLKLHPLRLADLAAVGGVHHMHDVDGLHLQELGELCGRPASAHIIGHAEAGQQSTGSEQSDAGQGNDTRLEVE